MNVLKRRRMEDANEVELNENKEGNFVQCRSCGHIYKIEASLPIDALIVEVTCPKCEHDYALNLGDDENDIYLYYDHTKDVRWYY